MEDPLSYSWALSQREARRLARAQWPRPAALDDAAIEDMAEQAASSTHRGHGWLKDYIIARGGLIYRRDTRYAQPDAPILLAHGPRQFAIYIPQTPGGKVDGLSEDWTLARGLGHLELHLGTISSSEDEDIDEPPPLYVPHLIGTTSPNYAARRQALIYATCLLFPKASFVQHWCKSAGDLATIKKKLSVDVPDLFLEARASQLGL